MRTSYHHGLEVLEIDTGTRPISYARSSVIGLVGTAPGAAAADFPLDTPVLIPGDRVLADKLGTEGTLPDAMRGIFASIGAMVVVVRVEEGDDDADTAAAVVGASAYEGLDALRGAQGILGIEPQIVIAPGFSQVQAVAVKMLAVAESLGGIALIDGPNGTDAEAIAYRGEFGSEFGILHDPWIKVFDPEAAAEVIAPVSADYAGAIAKMDNDRGWWHAPSSLPLPRVLGTARPVDHREGDPNTRANYLNGNHVGTVIREEGYVAFGFRSLATDPKKRSIKRRRIKSMINRSILQGMRWARDRNITRTFLEDVVGSVQAFLDDMIAREALVGGRVWVDPELNTPERLENDQVTIDFDFVDAPTAERITFRASINNGYLTEVLPVTDAA
jgi:phage tail sheath protein FI